jgi:hypothetical protein
LFAGGGRVAGDGWMIGDGEIAGHCEERAQQDVYPAKELTAWPGHGSKISHRLFGAPAFYRGERGRKFFSMVIELHVGASALSVEIEHVPADLGLWDVRF